MSFTLDDVMKRLDKLEILETIVETIRNIKSSVEQIQKKQLKLESRVNELSSENLSLKNQIETINSEVDRFKQHSLNTNLEIAGIPLIDNEDPIEIANRIFTHLGITDSTSIKYAYRKKTKKNRAEPPSIIIATNNKGTRDQILKRKRRETLDIGILGFSDTEDRSQKRLIYVNEHLTNNNKYLLKRAKDLRRSGIVFGAWVRNGYIIIKKEFDSVEQIITKISQINEFDTGDRFNNSLSANLE